MNALLKSAGMAMVVASLSISAQAATIATDYVGGGTLTTFARATGYFFTPSVNLTVTELGYYDYGSDGFVDFHEVGIFLADGTLVVGNVLPSGTTAPFVAGTVDGTRFHSVTPVLLLANTQYYIIADNNSTDQFGFGNGAVIYAPEITWNGYGDSSTNSIFGSVTCFTTGASGDLGPNFIYDYDANGVNHNPDAVNDAATVAEDSGANTIDVLANDSILPDTGETLTVTGFTHGTHGTVVITNAGANLTYAPAPDYFGADSFTYTISDGNGGTDTATVDVTVTDVSDPAVLVNTAVLKGTVNLNINWWNNGSDTNCDGWDDYSGKLEAWLIICFGEVYCPDCPIEVYDSYLWLVDKKHKEVYYQDGVDIDMFCIGGTDIVVVSDLDNLAADPDVVMVGKRKDTVVKGTSHYTTEIKSLKGYFAGASWDTRESNDGNIVCVEDTNFVGSTVSYNQYKIKRPKADCLSCLPSDICELAIESISAMLDTKYGDYNWWE